MLPSSQILKCLNGCNKPPAFKVAEENKGLCRSCIAKLRTPNKGRFRTTRNPLYNFWLRMRSECYNKDNKDYKTVGARGVVVYKAWHDFEKFKEWALMNGYVIGCSFKRKNPVLDFHPRNLTIINKPTSVYLYGGNELTPQDIFNLIKGEAKVPYNTFRKRLNRGWDTYRAFAEETKVIRSTIRVFGKEDNALGIVKIKVMDGNKSRVSSAVQAEAFLC